MQKLIDLSRGLEVLSGELGNIAFDWLEQNDDYLISTNQAQMYAGKTAEDVPITPSYSQDPYFDSPGEALAYAKYKDAWSHPERDWDTPNLFINGNWYYRHIKTLRFKPREIVFKVDFPIARDIYAKYPTTLGITPDNMREINERFILPRISKKSKEVLSV